MQVRNDFESVDHAVLAVGWVSSQEKIDSVFMIIYLCCRGRTNRVTSIGFSRIASGLVGVRMDISEFLAVVMLMEC